jgi:N-methylhydantoinase B
MDFSDTDPQSDGFVNAGYGAMVGVLGAIVMFTLAWDVPINYGIFRPVKLVLPPPGTVLNPQVPAPVSCGHMEGASKAGRVAWEAISKGLSLSSDARLQRRAAAAGVFSWPGNSWVGLSQFGTYTAFAVMDCGSGGMGAQTAIDGLDISSYEAQLNNGIPDVEVNEGFYPMLYLWRRLHTDSGGPGANRGGQGIDLAWAPWGTEHLVGTLENAMAAVPSRGMLGGYPGAGNFFKVVRDTALQAALARGVHLPQTVAELDGLEETLVNHVAGVPLTKADVFRQITGGGAGMGDPLLRDPDRVVRDVRDGYVSRLQAERAYGVVLDPAGSLNLAATEELRHGMRQERAAGTLAPVSRMAEWRPPLVLSGTGGDARYRCGHCGEDLASVLTNWKDGARVRRFELAERLAQFGIKVKARAERVMLLYEWACPGCGSLLETNLYPEDMAPLHDLHLGVGVAEPAGARAV